MKKKAPVVVMPGVIETAKKSESADVIVLVMHDLEALKVMEAWRLSLPSVQDRPLKKNEDPAKALADMWSDDVSPNFVTLSNLTRLPMNIVVDNFYRLQGAGILYPDGTVHAGALNALRNELHAYVKSLIVRK